jgi:hypothetical protein
MRSCASVRSGSVTWQLGWFKGGCYEEGLAYCHAFNDQFRVGSDRVPNIAGPYTCKNMCNPMQGTATIEQTGDTLTITNERPPQLKLPGVLTVLLRSMPMGGAVVFAQRHLQLERW